MNGFKTLSSYFDDTIDRLFGLPIKDIFSATETISRKSYTDPNGTNATYIMTEKDGEREEHFYIDGNEVEYLPDNIRRKMKSVPKFKNFIQPISPVNRLPSPLIKGSDFPALDMFLTEEGNLEIVSAIAGIEPERIGISFDNDYLKIKIVEASDDVVPSTVRKACLVKGIKSVDTSCYKEIFIDPNKFDAEGLQYKIEDGLLKINIPKSKNIRSFVFKEANLPKPEEDDKDTEPPKEEK